MKHLKLIVLTLLFLYMAIGCASIDKFKAAYKKKKYKVKNFTISEELKTKPPRTVAILPFKNNTEKEEAFEIVRKAFYNQFSFKTYNDVELHSIDTTLGSSDLLSQQKYLDVKPSELGRLLKTDALIFGEITAFDQLMAGVYSEVVIGASLRMVDCKTEKVLWQASHSVKHRGGGPPTGVLSIVPNFIYATLNIRDIEFLRVADDLSRDLVETIPAPDVSDALITPEIKLVAHDSSKTVKKAGDIIRVALIGDPGNIATFEMTGFKKGIPMRESPKGTYNGTYNVLPGDNVYETFVIGHLTDEKGYTSKWIDPLGTVTIDTTSPKIPKDLRARGRNNFVSLKWSKVADSDLAGYKIFRSESPLTGYKIIETVEFERFFDTGLNNFTTYFYKVSAVDQVGNESLPTNYITGVPVKPGPTVASGSIDVDTTWYMGASPYVIAEPVTIKNGATLTIEPGVVIKSKGFGIIVQGRLLARGDPDNYIQFDAEDSSFDLRWKGIIFDNTNDSESIVSYCKVKNAEIAIEAVTSSPVVTNNIIFGNGFGLVFNELSKSIVESNIIKQNDDTGIKCVDSAVIIRFNTITENNDGGILCLSSMPVISENSIYNNHGKNLTVNNQTDTIVNAINNWWGGVTLDAITSGISGPVYYAKILNAPYPDGKSISLERPSEAEKQNVTTGPVIASSEDITQMTEQGNRYLGESRLEDAKAVFKRIIAVKKDNHVAHFKIGLIYYQVGETSKALKEMKLAAALNPMNLGYLYNLGLLLAETGKLKEAITHWEKVLELDPNNQNAKMLVEMYKK